MPEAWRQMSEIEIARKFLRLINEYFFQTYSGIGKTTIPEGVFDYFSDFHEFWEAHHKDILNPQINQAQAKLAAECFSEAVRRYGSEILRVTHETHGLPPEAVAQVRFFTANQDFREPPKDQFGKYFTDPTRFDSKEVYKQPEDFLRFIGATRLSQSDKRFDFAKNAAKFLIDHGITAFDIARTFDNDAINIADALMATANMGYGAKKTHMLIRDMVELGVWSNLARYDQIDVASDINTMKIALRARILETDIPLLSSFLDIFCYQYGCIERMSANAWRAVWENWTDLDPTTAPSSPCELDFLLYRIGREYCKTNLVEYRCEDGHPFYWFGGRVSRCTVCPQSKRARARPISRKLPCQVSAAELPRSSGVLLIKEENLLRTFNGQCIFEETCQPKSDIFRIADPPRSISIKGQTGWTNSTSDRARGGGGMMA